MDNVLVAAGGIFWLLTYIEIIRVGFRDKTYGMPAAALFVNISWEFVNSFVYPADGFQLYINYLWLLLDLIIFYQLLKYWKNEFGILSGKIFYFFLIVFLATAYFIVIFFAKEFDLLLGSFYLAFGDNLMMSILFILMLYRRKSLRGQSVSIALFKLLGTSLISLGYFNYTRDIGASSLLKFLYVSIFIFDLIYLILVYLRSKKSLLFSPAEISQPSHGAGVQ